MYNIALFCIFVFSSIENEISGSATEIDQNGQINFTESIKLLQKHGITMLPTDDSNILSSILETGHSVVLTGKFNYLVIWHSCIFYVIYLLSS